MRHLITTILLLSLWAPGTAIAGLGNYRDIEACDEKVVGSPCEGTKGTGVCVQIEQCRHLLKAGESGERTGEWRSCTRCEKSTCFEKDVGATCVLGGGNTGICTLTGTELVTEKGDNWEHERRQDKITCERPPLGYYLRRPKYYLPAGGVLIVLVVAAIALVQRRRT